ncbi:lamin tail domain-containing protein [Chitinibacter fontanus]|uniref:Lamin tail domain-containing protein n=1 Tax=Chitinibacter fontanus TaxID=1737446 RepID=A0A7D5ZJC4_9NEIS|nr:carbohydrate-binding protein [Chitinibacter fontanus]QLI81450.1 lamin tail domain-containing protein [Chitinibacter fontanus]
MASAAACAPSWQTTTTYLAGNSVNYQGQDYRAKWWTQGENPANNSTVGKPWELVAACNPTNATPIPTPSITPSIRPSNAPTLIPQTPTPTSTPTLKPTTNPSSTPRPSASPSPTASPTATPIPSSSTCFNEWNGSSVYVVGNKVTRNGINYQAKWWTQGNDPAVNSGDAQPWQNLGSCGNTNTTPAPSPSNNPTSSPNPNPTTTPPNTGVIDHLVINEVAADATGQGSWFEIYNPTQQTVSLNDISVRIQSKTQSTINSYALSGSLDANSYVVISSNSEANPPKKNQQIQFIGNYQDWPVWSNDSGAIELVRNGQTVDFVRFGNNVTLPLTTNAWQGKAAPALSGNASYSLVRYFTQTSDTDSAADWRVVPFGTPAGRNDVDSNATDNDHDGIPTSAKQPGGSYAGLDLYAMGVRAGRPSILLHVDWMQSSTDEGIKPRKEALQMVREAFNRKGIDLLIDAGQLYSPVFNPADFNLGNGKEVPFARCVSLYKNPDCADVISYKNDSMDVRRRLIFHYMLMGSTQNTNGYGGSSGLAEINGNDLLVSLGFWGLNSSSANNLYMLINYQAGTIMHELGHNLGLQHGGNEATNDKPNYLSVMNYLYQLNGVPSDPSGQSMMERIYYNLNNRGKATPGRAANTYGVCDVLDGPCGNRFVIDYSNGSSTSLNENALNEAKLVGRGANNGTFADWNANAIVDSNVSFDTNNDGQIQTSLSDYDDWGKIQLAFNGGLYSVFGVSLEPILNSKQNRTLKETQLETAIETPPAAYLLPR